MERKKEEKRRKTHGAVQSIYFSLNNCYAYRYGGFWKRGSPKNGKANRHTQQQK